MQTNTDTYPIRSGHKTGGASKLAARAVDANPVRKRTTLINIVIAAMLNPNYVVEEIAHEIGESTSYTRPLATTLVNIGVLSKGPMKIAPSFGRMAHTQEAMPDLIRYIEAKQPDDVDTFRAVVGAFIDRRIELERRSKKAAKHGA
ncbi:hypothetical protein [uncultured Reyranella sp.]|uniref:hypothetical protein n=1 Tax=uncultured Reyranella sp. TaxID=735512 RepID=UPI0025CEA096|nr:hypothetical protein [uncultured Reyranella sp.]